MTRLFLFGLAIALLGSRVRTSHGFSQLPTRPISTSATSVHASTSKDEKFSPADIRAPNPFTYAEQSRKFRRDFYSHERWLQVRQKNRFIGTMSKIFESGVVRQLTDEVLLIGGMALFIVSWNCLFVAGYDDFSLVHHDPIYSLPFGLALPLLKLPLAPFQYCSPALSLLLVFKTNTSYSRWDEARKAWGVVVNNSRSVARQSCAWILQSDELSKDEKHRMINRVCDCVWLFPRSLQTHLWHPVEDSKPFAEDVRKRLANYNGQEDPQLAERIISARHKPTRALYEMSLAINELPLDTYQRTTIDEDVSAMCDALGACDRIFGSPVPSIYTRHTARFLELFLFFLPFALWDSFGFCWNHWFMIPSSMILAFFFLGIEEIAIQLEEPFSVLPLDKIAGGIGLSAQEHVQWAEEAMEQTQGRTKSRATKKNYTWF